MGSESPPISPRRMRNLVSIDDLSASDIQHILERARALLLSSQPPEAWPFTTGLVFMSPSLRTRVGFAVATTRLGGTPIDINEKRGGAGMSAAESLADTLRTVGGMVDLVVTRTKQPLGTLTAEPACPLINGGEGGGEHPTQALIDLLAIEEEQGDIAGLTVGLCGDLQARSVRSLVRLLARYPPRVLTLISPPQREFPDISSMGELCDRVEYRQTGNFEDIDVLYMAGLPAGTGANALTSDQRSRFSLDSDRLKQLAPDAVVLSPLPVIDEIHGDVRKDGRIKVFAQSDRGVAVRMACIELLLDR